MVKVVIIHGGQLGWSKESINADLCDGNFERIAFEKLRLNLLGTQGILCWHLPRA
jgi:hypothetical protein